MTADTRRWAFTPEAAEDVRAYTRLADGGEVALAGTADTERRLITAVRLLTCGSGAETFSLASDFEPNEVDLHTHPTGPVYPSAADLEAAQRAASQGRAFGITDAEASIIYMVREARPIKVRPTIRQRMWTVFGAPQVRRLWASLDALAPGAKGSVPPPACGTTVAVQIIATWEEPR